MLNKVKACLPLKQKVLFYNSIIKPLFNYASVIWVSASSKECISRILRLQKRAGRILLNAEPRAASVPIFNKLEWLPFYVETRIAKCALLLKRIQHEVPQYMIEKLKLNNYVNSRNTRFAGLNFLTPRYSRKTEAGKTFTITAIKEWNSLPTNLKKEATLKSFKNAMRCKFFNEQLDQFHFNP